MHGQPVSATRQNFVNVKTRESASAFGVLVKCRSPGPNDIVEGCSVITRYLAVAEILDCGHLACTNSGCPAIGTSVATRGSAAIQVGFSDPEVGFVAHLGFQRIFLKLAKK